MVLIIYVEVEDSSSVGDKIYNKVVNINCYPKNEIK